VKAIETARGLQCWGCRVFLPMSVYQWEWDSVLHVMGFKCRNCGKVNERLQ
jgi:hypothetical protein